MVKVTMVLSPTTLVECGRHSNDHAHAVRNYAAAQRLRQQQNAAKSSEHRSVVDSSKKSECAQLTAPAAGRVAALCTQAGPACVIGVLG